MLSLTKQSIADDTQMENIVVLGKRGTPDRTETISLQGHEAELAKELIVAEYNNLSTQLNSRQGIRYQMVQLALAAFGALLTVSSVGIQSHIDSLIFAYPVLVLILSIIYMTNAFESDRIKKYIKTKVEIHMPKEVPGWQHYRQGDKIERLGLGTVGNIGAKAVFILTAFFAVLIGRQIMPGNRVNDVFLYIALGASILLTLLLVLELFLYKLVRRLKLVDRSGKSENS